MDEKPFMKDFWNQRYAEVAFAYGTAPNDFIKEQAHQLPEGGKVLCLAAGEGRNAVYLAGLDYEVTAVDYSEAAKTKAEALAKDKGVSLNYVVADLNDYNPGNNQWDGITSIFAHTPSELRLKLLKHIVKALNPGGVLLLEGYTKEQLNYGTGGPKSADMLFDLEEVKTQLQPLQLLVAEQLEREVVEGAYHTGKASVCRVIARK